MTLLEDDEEGICLSFVEKAGKGAGRYPWNDSTFVRMCKSGIAKAYRTRVSEDEVYL